MSRIMLHSNVMLLFENLQATFKVDIEMDKLFRNMKSDSFSFGGISYVKTWSLLNLILKC